MDRVRNVMWECMEDVLEGVVAVYDFEKYTCNRFVDLSYVTTSFKPMPGDEQLCTREDVVTERRYETAKRAILVDMVHEDFTFDEGKFRSFLYGQKHTLPLARDSDRYNAIIGFEIGEYRHTVSDYGSRLITFTTANIPLEVDEIKNLLCKYKHDRDIEEYRRSMATRNW